MLGSSFCLFHKSLAWATPVNLALVHVLRSTDSPFHYTRVVLLFISAYFSTYSLLNLWLNSNHSLEFLLFFWSVKLLVLFWLNIISLLTPSSIMQYVWGREDVSKGHLPSHLIENPLRLLKEFSTSKERENEEKRAFSF